MGDDEKSDVRGPPPGDRASGANILEPPEDRTWGMRELLVADIDGNTFRIGCGSEGA